MCDMLFHFHLLADTLVKNPDKNKDYFLQVLLLFATPYDPHYWFMYLVYVSMVWQCIT